jgi:hypothetical protein
MVQKIFGYILLFLGVVIILYGLYASFNIFTGATPAPEIFSTPQETTSLNQEKITKLQTQDPQAQMEQMLGEQIGEQLKAILPPDFLPCLLNLSVWSIFVGILIFGGAQISGIGIKLLKS